MGRKAHDMLGDPIGTKVNRMESERQIWEVQVREQGSAVLCLSEMPIWKLPSESEGEGCGVGRRKGLYRENE